VLISFGTTTCIE